MQGRAFSVRAFYSKEPLSDYLLGSVTTTLSIHELVSLQIFGVCFCSSFARLDIAVVYFLGTAVVSELKIQGAEDLSQKQYWVSKTAYRLVAEVFMNIS